MDKVIRVNLSLWKGKRYERKRRGESYVTRKPRG